MTDQGTVKKVRIICTKQKYYEAVKAKSDGDTVKEVVYGKEPAEAESEPDWAKSTMGWLEGIFEYETIKKIRMNYQCGYGMDKKSSS